MPERRVLKDAYTQADSVVLLSQGVPFMQEGEEFMRSKKKADGTYEGNSYNCGDLINNMDYSLKVENLDVFNKIKEAIAFRKANAAFSLNSQSDINGAISSLTQSGGNITYKISYQGRNYYIIHAIKAASISLGSSYTLAYASSDRAIGDTMSSVSVKANETLVFSK